MTAAFRSQPDAPEAWRRKAVLGLFGVFAIVIVGKAFMMQVVAPSDYNRQGDRQHIKTQELRAHRGAVRDRNGEPLALSAPVMSITANPKKLLAEPRYIAAAEKVLQERPGELTSYLKERDAQGLQQVYLRRWMNPDDAQRLAALKAPGVEIEPDYRRYYPAGEVAAHVVGFLDFEGKAMAGVERTADTALSGAPGKRRVVRDKRRRVVEDPEELKPATPGTDVQLTLDLRLQYLAYRELKAAVESNKAVGGLIVLADARSGDILALASQPGFNPNRSDLREPEALRNRAVTMTFEPGSTIKPLMVAEALEARVISPDYHVDTGNGTYKIADVTVRDVHPAGDVDLTKLLAKSSNVGAAHIGWLMGAETMWTGYSRFGFGDPVRAGLPAESPTVLRDFHQWRPSDTVTASYGYSMTVNALQLVRAYCALANDGLMPALSVIARPSAVPPQRVVSAHTAQLVRRMMEGVTTTGGTGTKAAVPGYRVAGKTGTVKKNENGRYLEGVHQSAFIGMMPAEHPELVALVMIDEPGNGEYYGGAVSAPVFGRVMAGAARLLQIKPDEMPPALPKSQQVVDATAAPQIARSRP